MACGVVETNTVSSQILPDLLRLNSERCFLSATTAYFILLSSVFHTVALWQFRCGVASSTLAGEISVVGESFITSVEIHLQTLEFLLQSKGRFDHDVFPTMLHILRRVYQWNSHDTVTTELKQAVETLAYYRWCEGGTGLVALSNEMADHLKDETSWLLFENTWSLPYPENGHELERRRIAINSLCDLRVRACRPGFFDLSIRIF